MMHRAPSPTQSRGTVGMGGERQRRAARLFIPTLARPHRRGKVAALPAPTLSRRRGICEPSSRGLIERHRTASIATCQRAWLRGSPRWHAVLKLDAELEKARRQQAY
jgi:hypothetical protein